MNQPAFRMHPRKGNRKGVWAVTVRANWRVTFHGSTETPRELEELYSWLDQHCSQPVDARIQSDLAAGCLDKAISRALEDEKNGRVQPL